MARYLNKEAELGTMNNCKGVLGISNAAFVERYLIFVREYKPLGDRPRFASACTFSLGLGKEYEPGCSDDEFSADDALADGDIPAYRYFIDKANKCRKYTINVQFVVYPANKTHALVIHVYDSHFVTEKYQRTRGQGRSIDIDKYDRKRHSRQRVPSRGEFLRILKESIDI